MTREEGKPARHAPYDLGQAVAHLTFQAAASATPCTGWPDRPGRRTRACGVPDGFDPYTAIAVGRPAIPASCPRTCASASSSRARARRSVGPPSPDAGAWRRRGLLVRLGAVDLRRRQAARELTSPSVSRMVTRQLQSESFRHRRKDRWAPGLVGSSSRAKHYAAVSSRRASHRRPLRTCPLHRRRRDYVTLHSQRPRRESACRAPGPSAPSSSRISDAHVLQARPGEKSTSNRSPSGSGPRHALLGSACPIAPRAVSATSSVPWFSNTRPLATKCCQTNVFAAWRQRLS